MRGVEGSRFGVEKTREGLNYPVSWYANFIDSKRVHLMFVTKRNIRMKYEFDDYEVNENDDITPFKPFSQHHVIANKFESPNHFHRDYVGCLFSIYP